MSQSNTLLLFICFVVITSCLDDDNERLIEPNSVIIEPNSVIIEPDSVIIEPDSVIIEPDSVSCNCLLKSDNSAEYIHSNQRINSVRHKSANSFISFLYDGNKILSNEYYKDDVLYSYNEFNYYGLDSMPFEKLLFWGNGKFVAKTEYYYNEQGYLIRKLGYSSNLELVSTFEYLEHDEHGNILLEQRSGVFLRYTYDNKHWLDMSNPSRFPSSQQNNRLTGEIKNVDVGGNNATWSPFGSNTFNYDDCDFPSELFIIDGTGEKKIQNRYKYICY